MEEIETNPLQGNPSDPCEFFANVMESNGIDVTTPEKWLQNIPPEIRSLLSCGGGNQQAEPEYFWGSLGEFQTAYSARGVSGIHIQYGVHLDSAESGTGISFGLPIGVSASINYTISYAVEKYSNGLILTLRESYELYPPTWVSAVGSVILRTIAANYSESEFPVGEINFKDYPTTQNRKTSITYSGAENIPIKLIIEFRVSMPEETTMGASFGNLVMLPNP